MWLSHKQIKHFWGQLRREWQDKLKSSLKTLSKKTRQLALPHSLVTAQGWRRKGNEKGDGVLQRNQEVQQMAPSYSLFLILILEFLENSRQFDFPCQTNDRPLQPPTSGLNNKVFKANICTWCYCCPHRHSQAKPLHTVWNISCFSLVRNTQPWDGQWVHSWMFTLGHSRNTVFWFLGRTLQVGKKDSTDENEKEKTKFYLPQKFA